MKKIIILAFLVSIFLISCSSVRMINISDNEYTTAEVAYRMSIVSNKDDIFKVYKLEDGGYVICDIASLNPGTVNVTDLQNGIILTAEEAEALVSNLTKMINDCSGYTKELGVLAEVVVNEKVKESELNTTYVSKKSSDSLLSKSESSTTLSTERIAVKIQAYTTTDFLGSTKLVVSYATKYNYLVRETSINKIESLRNALQK